MKMFNYIFPKGQWSITRVIVLFIIFGISVYFIFIFDINNYKTELEDIISEKSNTEFRIS